MRRTKIVCTIGPASSTLDELDRLVKAGMDVARLNFSHGTHAEHADVVRRIREGESRWGRPISILQDLQGPKIRLGTFGPAGGARIDLEAGQPFTLSATPVAGTAERSAVSHPEYLRELTSDGETAVLVLMPELVVRGWRRLLHNQRALYVKRLLLFEPGVILASVPYQLLR